MKRIALLIICFITICEIKSQIYIDNQGNIYEQGQYLKKNSNSLEKQKKPLVDLTKLEFGGNFGLQLGDYTHLSISPQIGYRMSRYVSLGIGVGYNYLSTNQYDTRYTDKYSAVTVGTYAHLYPIEPLVLSLQPEISRVWQTRGGGAYRYSESSVAPTLLLGGGIMYQGMMLMIQYDLIQNKYSPYGDGIFYTAGFYFDL